MDYQSGEHDPDLDAFSVYLLDDPALTLLNLEYPDVNELELQSRPLFTADDIMSYDWNRHTFTLTKTATAELPSPGVFGVPFVLVSQGQRQYLGFFWSMVSSVACPHPVIFVDQYADGCLYSIEAGIPDPEHAGEVDPRQSQAIKEALQAAGILINAINIQTQLSSLAGNEFVLQVNRIWERPDFGMPTHPFDELSECDYNPVNEGPQYGVRFSEECDEVELTGHNLMGDPAVGYISADSDEFIRFEFQYWAGGRLNVWSLGDNLEVELTQYGSGVPIVNSERGELLETGNR
jgi:hypothetical protein